MFCEIKNILYQGEKKMTKKFPVIIFSFLVLGMFFTKGVSGVKIVGSSPVERRLESKEVEAPVETVVSGEKEKTETGDKVEEKEVKDTNGFIFIIIIGAVVGWVLLKSFKKRKKK